MAMNFNQLEYFVAIIEQKSLSKAANKLFITQPALTLSMQNLEKEIGFPLLNKYANGVIPTAEGEIFYSDCLQILKYRGKWDQLRLQVQNKPQTVNFAVTNAIELTILDRFVVALNHHFSNIRLNIISGPSSFVEDSHYQKHVTVSVNSCDYMEIEIVKRNYANQNYVVTFFYQDTYVAYLNRKNCLAKKHFLTMQDIENLKVVTYLNEKKVVEKLGALYNSRPYIYMDKQSHIFAAISQNIDYYTIFPKLIKQYSSNSIFKDIKCLPVRSSEFDSRVYFYIAYPSKKQISSSESHVVEVFLEACRQYLGPFSLDIDG